MEQDAVHAVRRLATVLEERLGDARSDVQHVDFPAKWFELEQHSRFPIMEPTAMVGMVKVRR